MGHLPRVFRFLDDPIAAVTELRPLGDVVGVCGGSPALVCAFGAERNREVLSNPNGFRHDEGFLDGPPGSSLSRMSQVLVQINGDDHKRHRRLLAPRSPRPRSTAMPTTSCRWPRRSSSAGRGARWSTSMRSCATWR